MRAAILNRCQRFAGVGRDSRAVAFVPHGRTTGNTASPVVSAGLTRWSLHLQCRQSAIRVPGGWISRDRTATVQGMLVPLILAVAAVLVVVRWNAWHCDMLWRRNVRERFSADS